MTLSRKNQDRNQVRRHHHNARPRSSLELLPHHHLVVIDHRMLDIVFKDGVSDFVRALLINELGTVTPHEDN